MADATALVEIVGKQTVSGPAGVAANALHAVESAAGKATNVLTGLATTAIKVGVALASISAAGVTAALTAATSSAAAFEKQMSAVGAVSGATAEQMKELQSLALQLGKDTSYSATEAAQGLEELVKAGVSVKDIMGGAGRAALDLAAAGAVSVADAAEIASNALNVFSLKGEDMAHVADVIAGAANASAISVTDYKFSLAAAGAVAATVGIGFEDLSTAIAVMGSAGIKGSDAGTSLKTMLLNLQPSTKAAKEEFKRLGLITKDGGNAFFDAQGKAKSLAEISGVLQKATKGMTEQQKLASLEILFGSDAIRAAAILTKEGAAGFKEMAGEIGKVKATEVADKRLNNLSGSLEKLRGSIETVAIGVGLKFTPALKRLTDVATELVNRAGGPLEKWAEMAAVRFDALIDRALASGPALRSAGAAVVEYGRDVMQLARGMLPMLTGAFGQARGILSGDMAGNVAGGIRSAIAQIQAAIAPLLPVVQGIAQTLITGWIENFRFLTDRVLPPFLSIIQQTGQFFLSTLLPAAQTTGRVLRSVLGDTLDWLATDIWPSFLSIAGQTATFWTGTLLPAIQAVAGPLRNALGTAIQWLAETGWPMLLSAAKVAIDYFTGTILPMLPTLAGQIRDGLGAALQWVTETGWPMFLAAARIVTTWVTGTAIPALTSLVEWLGPKVSAVVGWLIDTGWPMLKSAAATTWEWISGTAIPVLQEWWSWFQEKITPVVQWLAETGWPAFKQAASDVWTWITGTAIPVLQEWWTWLEEKTRPTVQWFIDTGWPALQSAGQAVVDGWTAMRDIAELLWQKLERSDIVLNLKDAFNDLWDAGKIIVETFFPDLKRLSGDVNPLLDAFVAIVRVGAGFVRAFAAGVKTIAEGLRAIKNAADAMPDWLVKALQAGAFGAPGVGIGNAIAGSGGRTGMANSAPNTSAGASISTTGLPPIDNSSRASFVKTAFPYMLAAAGGDRKLAEMMLAKAISENGDVGKGGAFIGNNFSGIKGKGSAGSFTARTWEMVNGQRVSMDQEFAAYNTPQEGFEAFLKFLKDNRRYAEAIRAYQATGDVQQLFRDINMAGYATDPNWAATVENIRKNQVEPLTRDLTVAQEASNQFSDATASAGQAAQMTVQPLQNVDQVLIAVATGLYQAREAMVTTGEANTAVAQSALPLIDAMERQGAISKETAEQLRGMSNEILAAGKASDAAVPSLDAAAQQAADVARRAAEAEHSVSALSDSLNDLPDWFTPTGGKGAALFAPERRAGGGPVRRGQPYIVGDGGRPEVFVPPSDGMILPSIDSLHAGVTALDGAGPRAFAGQTVGSDGGADTRLSEVMIGRAIAREMAPLINQISKAFEKTQAELAARERDMPSVTAGRLDQALRQGKFGR